MEDPRKYIQTAKLIRASIENGNLKPGDRAPSIMALCEETGHSRQTIGKALRLLEGAGWLRRVQGVGYFVDKNAR
jgi:GntR family transcriptional regulator, histidine utilization repressor